MSLIALYPPANNKVCGQTVGLKCNNQALFLSFQCDGCTIDLQYRCSYAWHLLNPNSNTILQTLQGCTEVWVSLYVLLNVTICDSLICCPTQLLLFIHFAKMPELHSLTIKIRPAVFLLSYSHKPENQMYHITSENLCMWIIYTLDLMLFITYFRRKLFSVSVLKHVPITV